VLFRQGDTQKVFYIVMAGRISQDTVIDIDEFNKYPVVRGD